MFIYLIVFIVLFSTAAEAGETGAALAGQGELLRVVIVSRPGVHAPAVSPETLAKWTVSEWPDFEVPPGHLTPRGGELMRLMGTYYRDYLAAQGLFARNGCPAATHVHWRADNEPRGRASAERMREGFAPGCDLPLHTMSARRDPLFHPVEAGICRFDIEAARAAVMARVGGDFATLEKSSRETMHALQDILRCCTPKLCDKSFGGPGGPCTLPRLPTRLKVEPARVTLTGGMALASSFAEILLLEYGNGFRGRDFGFGRADPAKMREALVLHALALDIVQATPYIARRQGSMLLDRLIRALTAAANEARFIAYLGHEANLVHLAAMLGASWQQPGHSRNQTLPGGALAFELWRDRDGGLGVHAFHVAQSLKQLGTAEALDGAHPPQRSALRLPCSRAAAGHSCRLEDFGALVRSALVPQCVR
ncbi:MAG: histidine-type phosphatase [Burkholderiales bacterium]